MLRQISFVRPEPETFSRQFAAKAIAEGQLLTPMSQVVVLPVGQMYAQEIAGSVVNVAIFRPLS